MTSCEKLKNLIRLFHEKHVVEKIVLSRGDICVYNWQCWIFEKELKSLKEDSEFFGFMVREEEYWRIPPEDSIQISFICMMAKIDHFKLLQIYEELPVSLRDVKGAFSVLAERIAHYIGFEGDGDKNMSFLDYPHEDFLKYLFD